MATKKVAGFGSPARRAGYSGLVNATHTAQIASHPSTGLTASTPLTATHTPVSTPLPKPPVSTAIHAVKPNSGISGGLTPVKKPPLQSTAIHKPRPPAGVSGTLTPVSMKPVPKPQIPNSELSRYKPSGTGVSLANQIFQQTRKRVKK